MKRKLHSVKLRIVLTTAAFTLLVMVALVTASLRELQGYARQNLIQSTEFNLHLVCGLIRQDLNAVDTLRRWCTVNSQVADYLREGGGSARLALDTLQRLSDEVTYNRAYTYLRRVILTDSRRSRILQVGTATAEGAPVTVYTIGGCGAFSPAAPQGFTKIEDDPFISPTKVPTLPLVTPIQSGEGALLGYAYFSISTKIITGPLESYRPPEGGALYLTVGQNHYRLVPQGFQVVSPVMEAAPTGDRVMNAATAVRDLRAPDGGRSVAVSCPIGETGLALTQTLPYRLIAHQKWLYMRLLLLVSAGVLLLGLGLALLLNRMINSPVALIRRRLGAIAGGDFSPDPHIEWEDEFGDIGRGINQLSRDVHSLMETRLEDEKKKRDLEYQMLQSQINPHFLYNTLNSIKWMATIQNAPGIAEMTTSLARLMKNIAKGQQKIIPLREEIALLDDYFLIQQYRYGGSITLQKELDEAVLGSAIPRFTLQPLLENAIFHGIEPKGGAGTVKVSARRDVSGDVLVAVEDDGVGMDEGQIARALAGGETPGAGLFRQIGLSNVLQRIRYDFGAPYGLQIESTPGEYTRMVLRLPYQILPGPQEDE